MLECPFGSHRREDPWKPSRHLIRTNSSTEEGQTVFFPASVLPYPPKSQCTGCTNCTFSEMGLSKTWACKNGCRSLILLICSRRSKTSSRNSLPGNPISKSCWMKKMSVSNRQKTGMFWKRNWLGSGSMVRCLQNIKQTHDKCPLCKRICLYSGWMLVVFTRSNTFYVYLEAEVGSGNHFWSDAISAKYLSPEKLGHNCLSSFSSSLLLVFPFYVFPVFITSSSLSLLIVCN